MPAGNTKWIASDAQTLAMISMMSLATTLPNNIDIKAMDGTNYSISSARLKSMAEAYVVQLAAIDAAEVIAVAQYQAAPDSFDIYAVQWPVQYTPE